LLISAVGLTRLLTARPHWLIGTTVALVALQIGLFCLIPEYPLGPGTQRLLSRATLVNSDHYYQDRFTVIEENFALQSTAILAANWHHVEYYLPEYAKLPITVQTTDGGGLNGDPPEAIVTPKSLGLLPNGQGQVVIVVFDSHLLAFNESPKSIRELPLKHGGELTYFVLTDELAFHYDNHSFGIREN
jgi:hypothetical protein